MTGSFLFGVRAAGGERSHSAVVMADAEQEDSRQPSVPRSKMYPPFAERVWMGEYPASKSKVRARCSGKRKFGR